MNLMSASTRRAELCRTGAISASQWRSAKKIQMRTLFQVTSTPGSGDGIDGLLLGAKSQYKAFPHRKRKPSSYRAVCDSGDIEAFVGQLSLAELR